MTNDQTRQKTIGIIGGMGPKATALLFNYIIDYTDASSDQDHIRIIIDNNTKIPDRTNALLFGGESPKKELTLSAKILKQAGADFIIVPCNTSHFYLQDISQETGIPILSMIHEVALQINDRKYNKVGLLATDGTIQTNLYGKAFRTAGVETLIPDNEGQRCVMDFIYNCIKSGNYDYDLHNLKCVLNTLYNKGAQTIVLGCTELSFGFDYFGIEGNFIDALKVLAKSSVLFAGYPVKDTHESKKRYCH